MRVLDPRELEERRDHRTKSEHKKKRKHLWWRVVLLGMAMYIGIVMILPVPSLQISADKLQLKGAQPVSMPWPSQGQAAVGAVGYGLLTKHGDEKPLPTASVAKVLTALAVLKAKPITAGSKGETITITADDVKTYESYLAQGQSTVKVTAGETLTEYQALQALLLPSANNMADVLARWAFGSTDNYLAFVNPFTKTLGMTNTNMSDASGFSPKTTSTAVDLTKLAEIAMNHPVISEIVSQTEADLPTAGTVQNVNFMLGQDGIVGVKTGNTDEAGGCFMFAARREVEGQKVTVVGTVMGAPNLFEAIKGSQPLIDETFKNFHNVEVVKTGQTLGSLNKSGGSSVPVLARQGLRTLVWAGQAPSSELVGSNLGKSVKQGDDVGTLQVHVGNQVYPVTAEAAAPLAAGSLIWRLSHAGGYL